MKNSKQLFNKPVKNYNGGGSELLSKLKEYLRKEMSIDTAGSSVSMDFIGGTEGLPIALRASEQDRAKAVPDDVFECIYCQVTQRKLGDVWGLTIRKCIISDKGTGWAYCGIDRSLRAHVFVRFRIRQSTAAAFDGGGKVLVCEILPVPKAVRLTARAGKGRGADYVAETPQGKQPNKGRGTSHVFDYVGGSEARGAKTTDKVKVKAAKGKPRTKRRSRRTTQRQKNLAALFKRAA